MRPRALDLFCKAGGASRGLQLAGFHVTGVDHEPQPRYCGDAFILGDACMADLEAFDFVWASPPCQRYSLLAHKHGNAEEHPDLVAEIRGRLKRSGIPFVIENVPLAPLEDAITLCGTMFGLGIAEAQLWRHRCFESHGFEIGLVPPCSHKFTAEMEGQRFGALTVTGHTGGTRKRGMLKQYTVDQRRAGMGIDWMTNEELAQAIPPAYAEFIGRRFLHQFCNNRAISSLRGFETCA